MHTMMDLKGSIPIFIRITEVSIPDSKVMYVKFDSLYKYLHIKTFYGTTRNYGLKPSLHTISNMQHTLW